MYGRSIVANFEAETMRGADVTQGNLFSYLTLEDYVPEKHPLRPIREIVNAALPGALVATLPGAA